MTDRSDGVVQRRDGAGLALEALAELRIAGDVRREHFDRNRAVEPRIASFVDFTHPAAAERRNDLIRTQTRTAR